MRIDELILSQPVMWSLTCKQDDGGSRQDFVPPLSAVSDNDHISV